MSWVLVWLDACVCHCLWRKFQSLLLNEERDQMRKSG